MQKRSKLFHALLLTPFNFADNFPDEGDDDYDDGDDDDDNDYGDDENKFGKQIWRKLDCFYFLVIFFVLLGEIFGFLRLLYFSSMVNCIYLQSS